MQGLGLSQGIMNEELAQVTSKGLISFSAGLEQGSYAQLMPMHSPSQLQQLTYQQAYMTSSPNTGGSQYLGQSILLNSGDSRQDLTTERQVCTFYLRTGTCAYGDRCKFEHPKDRPPPALNSRGYPVRPGEPDCAHYIKKGWCAFSVTCKFNHPEPALPTVQYSAQQGSYVPVRPLQPMPGMPQPYYYTYPAPQAAAGPALYPVGQPAAMAGHMGAPMAAAMAAQGMMYPGASMAAAGMGMRQPGMQAMAPMGMDQLTSGLGGLRLQQGGQQQQMGHR